jgi:hypothetical protein
MVQPNNNDAAIAAILAAQRPIPRPPAVMVQPNNNDAVIAAILAAQQPHAVRPPAVIVQPNNNNAILAALLAKISNNTLPINNAPLINNAPPINNVQPRIYDPVLDCVGDKNDPEIGCI